MRARLNPAYAPNPGSTATFETLARVLSSRIFKPGQTEEAAAAIRRVIGTGPTATRGRELDSMLVTPYLLLVALVPLLFLLARGNVGRLVRRRSGTPVAVDSPR